MTETKRPFHVLGIHHSGPITSAAIVRDGVLVAGSPEERFTRIKHDRSFPHKAIQFCLERCDIALGDVDLIAIGWNPGENVAIKYRGGFSDWMRYPGEWLASVPNHVLPIAGLDVTGVTSQFHGAGGRDLSIRFMDHHVSHARLVHEISGHGDCALLIVDGWSEQKVTSAWRMRGDTLELLRSRMFPHSIGGYYAAMTDYLGYKPFSDEWKVMGMAAYGNPAAFPQLGTLIPLLGDGDYELDLKYFDFYNFDRGRFFSADMEKLLGEAPRKAAARLTQRHFDLAAATQALLEKVLTHQLTWLHNETASEKLCFSGGVAMNCLYNGKIVGATPFKRVSVSFAPDDSGNSIGAAFAACAEAGVRVHAVGHSAAIGIEFGDEAVGQALERFKLRSRKLDDEAAETATLLAEEKVVAWFQGRSEFGQRALGHRSILASPRKAEMKDRINAVVKYRETYRPFAPSVPFERVGDVFATEDRDPVRYMEKTFRFLDEARTRAAAVVHEDGTGRLQTVSKDEEPLFHRLLLEFERASGVPVLLNTSFNLNGEPVVNTPEDAIRTFMTSGIDALVLGKHLLEKGKL
ncbi:MAG: carbamoyltransferase [Chloroflexi bacterium]|nr:carbamoyltransferase [Chloroflexota bacterium]